MKNKIDMEAVKWFKNNKNKFAFADNCFEGTKKALAFVKKLYRLGATKVEIDPTSVSDEAERIEEEGGPYADAFIIYLPKNKSKRLDLQSAIYFMRPTEIYCGKGYKPANWNKDDVIMVWWD